nr:glycosyltransferase [Longispora sp. (in: high G+C Gram-positive bacteria)]
MEQLYGAAALIVVGFGILYCFGLVAAGALEFRRTHRRVSDQGCGDYAVADEAAASGTTQSSHHVYALVAALNEEAVIEATVRGLLGQSPQLRVILVDDASTDDTVAIAQHAGGDRIQIVSRVLPDARLGKGPALNVGFAHVIEDVLQRQLDPTQVLVCVMDADGRLSTGAVNNVAVLFEDERVGGVQLAVRILNRDSLLTEMQDFEFWGVSALAQVGRMGTGTVSLGGNGQFARLSALQGLGRPPWSDSLTEDLDLTISLLLDGWRLTSSLDASVGQQAVGSLRQLVRQRTRWFQGHMVCGRRLLEIWGSRRMSHAAVFELSLYLSIPWLLVLPWSVFFHVGLLFALGGAGVFDAGSSGGIGRILAWLVVS